MKQGKRIIFACHFDTFSHHEKEKKRKKKKHILIIVKTS
jgi:hypothetical protein